VCHTLSLASCVQGVNATLRKHHSHEPNPAWCVKESVGVGRWQIFKWS
jgi:hypothetical protein